ncbi:MAG: DUF5668 domain-containing protein [Acidobacteriota bacterium]|nr:DUF5668 domain-containing protein [Acidobacteriota bacterium]
MRYYVPNPACSCGRCATRGLMGPAVLITLGLLFLLSNVSDWSFHRTWPILLIVIGLVKVVRYVVSDDAHLNPGQYPPPYGYGPVPPPYVAPGAAQPAAPPPPAPTASTVVDAESKPPVPGADWVKFDESAKSSESEPGSASGEVSHG